MKKINLLLVATMLFVGQSVFSGNLTDAGMKAWRNRLAESPAALSTIIDEISAVAVADEDDCNFLKGFFESGSGNVTSAVNSLRGTQYRNAKGELNSTVKSSLDKLLNLRMNTSLEGTKAKADFVKSATNLYNTKWLKAVK